MSKDFSIAYCPVKTDMEYYHLLTEQEKELLSSKATPKRIADFCTGRVAAKQAVRSYLSLPESSKLSILREEKGEEAGRPYAVIDESETRLPVFISITHADQKAYAVASSSRVGIDNVTLEEYGTAFVEEVFQKDELRAWSDWLGVDVDHPLAYCSGFAAKEAFLKWLGVGLRYSLSQLKITPIVHDKHNQNNDVFERRFSATCCWQIRTKDNYRVVNLEGYFMMQNSQVLLLMIGEEGKQQYTTF
jgi:phosphopantetheinyl transferase (holo-ACP synthase)